jgi:hypothetical protein
MTANRRAATFITVSEDIYNRGQSWNYAGVYCNNSGQYRVEIRANAYEEQSHATVSVWGVGGWLFHTLLPTDEWYADAPSYTQRELTTEHEELFRWVRDTLLNRLGRAKWGTNGVNITNAELTERDIR